MENMPGSREVLPSSVATSEQVPVAGAPSVGLSLTYFLTLTKLTLRSKSLSCTDQVCA